MPNQKGKTTRETHIGRKKIGDIFIDAKLITQEQMEEALQIQAASGERLGKVLIDMGFLEEKDLVQALSKQLNLDSIDLNQKTVPKEILSLLSESFILKNQVIPIERSGNNLKIAMANPLDHAVIRDAEFMVGGAVIPVVAAPSAIERFLNEQISKEAQIAYYTPLLAERVEIIEDVEAEIDLVRLKNAGESQAIIRTVNKTLFEAALAGASHIHFEPRQKEMIVRYRIDGVLHNKTTLPKNAHSAIVARLKMMSQMDLSVREKPQNSKIRAKISKEMYDLHISVIPTLFGERVTVRILSKFQKLRNLEDLMILPTDKLKRYQSLLARSHGFIIVAGPVGNGVTTTLYASIRAMRSADRNIVTLEDPVEFRVSGINQIQVNPKEGITLVSGIQSILLQDPDVIMISNITSQEVAEIAFHAALTGHLFLSRVRTRDAVSAIMMLKEIGVKPYLIGSSVAGIIAQRLVRRNCHNCLEQYTPAPEVFESLQADVPNTRNMTFYHGAGCKMCNNTGYSGMIGIYEVLTVDDVIKDMIVSGASEKEIKDAVISGGMMTMEDNGLFLCQHKITTVEEIFRVIPFGKFTDKSGI